MIVAGFARATSAAYNLGVLRFILGRVLALVPVLFGISLLTFALLYLIPGDPVRLMSGQHADPEVVAEIRHQMGLDLPRPVQYVRFVWRALHGDLGRSYVKKVDVSEFLADKFVNTLYLTFVAMFIAVFVGVGAGLLAASKPHSWLDYTMMFAAVLGLSLPVFWLGLMMQLVFASWLHVLPVSGISAYGNAPIENLKYVILPALTLSTVPMAIIARMTRSSMLEVSNLDYILAARAKGLSERVILYKHVLRNALIPVVTVIGNNFAILLTGAVLTETVFSWPGLGRTMVNAIEQRDFPVVMGGVLMMAVIFVVVNLLVDILYAFIDPRIRYS